MFLDRGISRNCCSTLLCNVSISLCVSTFANMFFLQDESQDYIKRQQLRELAMLNNSNFREESPGPSGSVSPFNTSGMKRAKTGR